jgi:hypothetical protein
VRRQRTETGDQLLCPALAELDALTLRYGAQRLDANGLKGAEAIGSVGNEAAVKESEEPLGETLTATERGRPPPSAAASTDRNSVRSSRVSLTSKIRRCGRDMG